MSVVVCFGEVMLRLTPPGYTRYSQTQSFDVAFGGAENNVAVSTACFGDQSRMITKLPNNAIADMFMQQMRSVGVDVSQVVRGGERMGIYFVEKGASLRPTRVTYDHDDAKARRNRLGQGAGGRRLAALDRHHRCHIARYARSDYGDAEGRKEQGRYRKLRPELPQEPVDSRGSAAGHARAGRVL